ncbi:MAG: hypothetical protein HY898_21575 [Deltaproteobacteria bacterium]|nr:hypothetical protein [Deltaproteobacteria bacterium]
MNFLAHDVILPPGSAVLTRVGASLPDIWVLLPRRPLPLAIVRGLRQRADPLGVQLADGIESHMRADAVFHGHAEFQRRMAVASSHLRESVAGLRHTQLAAHVAVEMVLDRWLIDHDPGLLDRYYQSFDPASLDTACRLGSHDPESATVLRQILDRFASSAFLREYVTAKGMVARWMRSLSRTPFAENRSVDESRWVELVERWRSEFAEGSDKLIDDVRSGVEAWDKPGRSAP